MHVVYIHQHFSTNQGAFGTGSYEFGKRLVAAGHRVTMICGLSSRSAGSFEATDPETHLDIEGIHVVCLAEPYANEMGFRQRALAFTRFARCATSVVRRLDPDLVFATSTPLTVGLPGMKGARYHRVPFVFEVRDRWPEVPIAMGVVRNPLFKAYLRRLERRIYFAAQRVVALAPGIRDGICSTGYPADQVDLLPNGCDLELFVPSDAPLDDPKFGPPGALRLVFSGAHGVVNDLHRMLDAVVEIKRRGLHDIHFCFIGDGASKAALVERSERESLGDLASWLPLMPKQELAQVLPRMDVGLMVFKNLPALYYGTSPNKFFDYISAGIPVLSNYPGWLADKTEANQCGLVVAPEDPVAFADAVVWLRDHPTERQAMGRRARELAEREFSREDFATRFVTVLETVHAEGRAR